MYADHSVDSVDAAFVFPMRRKEKERGRMIEEGGVFLVLFVIPTALFP